MSDEETIFAEALSKGSEPERDAYLERACAGNSTLRRNVDALLFAHKKRGGILEAAPVAIDPTTHTSALPHAIGTTIGPYKLLEQIGEGGMGVVYMAEQLRPVRRKVALKIIKPGMDSGQVIARFEAERQALAMMDHPNIARVFDAGVTDTGRPYFVMELVKGIAITDYCDQARLDTRQRLELFMLVCQAVQHAHQKGVIHRDLKPSNVLVTLHDDKPVPKIIDFGIAKAAGQILTDKTLFTNYAQMLGTPLYMSPEQAQISGLDVDTRSDVYSLGVLLYELLTGTTPFDKQRLREAAYDEMRRIIREEEPPRPSTRLSTMGARIASVSAQRHTEPKKLSQLVHGELDWIAMKALEKDRTRRYETASGLARDVERHLLDEPVQACPPSGLYRFRKFARRNKAALVIASTAVATLMLLVLGLAISNRLISKALADKKAALRVAQEERNRAESNFWKAAVAVRDVVTDVATGKVVVPPEPRRHFTATAIRFYQSLLDESSSDPSRRYESAIGYRSIGIIHASLQEYEQAEKAYRRAIEILDRLSAEHANESQYRDQLAYAHVWLARTLDSTARAENARATRSRAKDLYERVILQEPDNADALAWLGRLASEEAMTHLRAGRTQEFQKVFPRVLDLSERAAKAPRNWTKFSQGVVYHRAGGHTLRLLAFDLIPLHRNEEADRCLRGAINVFERAHEEEPLEETHLAYLADTRRLLGASLLARSQFEEAERQLRDAVKEHELRRAKWPDTPSNRVNDLEWSTAYFDLARVLIKTARTQEAVPLIARGVESALINDGQPVKLKVQTQLGNLLREAGKLDQAMAKYSEVIASTRGLAEAWAGRAECHRRMSQFVKMAEDYSQAITLQPNNQAYWHERAYAYMVLGDYKRSIDDHSRSIELGDQDAGQRLRRGQCYRALGELKKAEEDFSRAIVLNPNDWAAWYARARLYHRQAQPEEAQADLQNAVERVATSPDAQNGLAWSLCTDTDPGWRNPALAVELAEKAVAAMPDNGFIMNTLGAARYRNGQWQEAITAMDKSMQLRAGGDSADWFFLAMAHWQLDHKDHARKWYDQTADWMEKHAPKHRELLLFRKEAAALLGVDPAVSRPATTASALPAELPGAATSRPVTSTRQSTR